EMFKETKVKKVVSTCAHCFNTLKNEYAQFGVELEVVHHTQLLNRLVREGKLTPVPTNGGPKRTLTYHDPCYIGRHNQVYSPPRELLNVIPDAELKEMPRNSERSFCCGAGGARMWMEETIGERINVNRTNEAVETGADQIAVGCPFCRVMLSDGLTAMQADGKAREEVEVLDVAQMLLASVKGESRTPVAAGVSAKAEPSKGDVTQTPSTVTDTAAVGAAAAATEEKTPEASKPSGSGSLFDAAPEAPSAPSKAAEPSGTSGGSLFDTPAESAPAESKGGSLFDTPAESAPAESEKPAPKAEAKQESSLGSGSLFDTPADSAPTESAKTEQPKAAPAPQDKAETPASEAKTESKPAESNLGSGGSLFDVAPSEPEPAKPAQPKAAEPAKPAQPKAAEPKSEESAGPAETNLGSGGSLFDIAPSEPEPAKAEPAVSEAADQAPEDKAEPAPATSSGETNQPQKPEGGIDEKKSLFDF
ncbi:MAG TPA: heterodisulfide reductase-related iron-sulfur binding cluster, partial [Nocardioidaceae bacterium]|nr:heterodisulfide reductase-related iron-sulfur binding cluster [Nocardioidaceae bacterium]